MKKFNNYENHIVVINHNGDARFRQIIEELKTDLLTKELSILLIDEFIIELPLDLYEKGVSNIVGNPSHGAVLEKANLKDAKHIIILAQDSKHFSTDDKSIGIVLMIRSMKVTAPIICECIDPQKIKLLDAAGCKSIVCISKFSTNMMVQELLDPCTIEVVNELTSNTFGQQIYLVLNNSLKSIQQIKDYYLNQNYIFIGIKREDQILLNPKNNFALIENDQIIVIGNSRPS